MIPPTTTPHVFPGCIFGSEVLFDISGKGINPAGILWRSFGQKYLDVCGTVIKVIS